MSNAVGIRCAGREREVFYVSPEDGGWAAGSRWYAVRTDGRVSVVRYEAREGGKRTFRLAAELGQRIWGNVAPRAAVFHINGDSLDFRRENLHRAPRSASHAPGKGVSRRERDGRVSFTASATLTTPAGSRRVSRTFDNQAAAAAWREEQVRLSDPLRLAVVPPPEMVSGAVVECAPPPISSAWSTFPMHKSEVKAAKKK